MDDDESSIEQDGGMILRSAMAAIPLFAPLATWWGEFEASKNSKRLKLFIDSLSAITNCHSRELDAIQSDIEHNEDRVSILEVTVDKVVKEWQEEKIKLHANLAVHNLVSQDPIEKRMAILEQFSELSVPDLNILMALSKSNSTQVLELDGHVTTLVPILSKLEARGLIAETDQGKRGMFVMAGTNKWQDKWTHKFYTCTPFGQELLDAIQ